MEPDPYTWPNWWQLCVSQVTTGRLQGENLSVSLHLFVFDLWAVLQVVFEKMSTLAPTLQKRENISCIFHGRKKEMRPWSPGEEEMALVKSSFSPWRDFFSCVMNGWTLQSPFITQELRQHLCSNLRVLGNVLCSKIISSTGSVSGETPNVTLLLKSLYRNSVTNWEKRQKTHVSQASGIIGAWGAA